MKAIYLKGHIDNDLIEKAIDKFNAIDENESIDLYFNSTGGSYSDGLVLIDFLNNQNRTINMICFEYIDSIAFHIFIKSNTIKTIHKHTSATIHLISSNLDFRDMNKKYGFSATEFDRLNCVKNDDIIFYTNIIDDDNKIKEIESGNDVCLGSNEIANACKKLGYKIDVRTI